MELKRSLGIEAYKSQVPISGEGPIRFYDIGVFAFRATAADASTRRHIGRKAIWRGRDEWTRDN